MSATWKNTAAGRGSVVLVSGEAGIGKTRFCAELADDARRSGLRVVTARCWVGGGAPALWPWQPVLRELCGPEGAALVAPASGSASGSGDETGSPGWPTAPGPPGPDRFERFAAVADCFATAGADRPVCLVIDDVHGADAGTLLLIRYLVQSLHRLPLALVLSRRSGEPAGRQPGETGEAQGTPDGPDAQEARDPRPAEAHLLEEIEREATPVVLPPFDLQETTAFLTTQGLADLEPDLLQALFRLTGGNPLFLRRVAALGARELAQGLPSGLQVAIEEAWSRLSPTARHVIRSSAVLGLEPSIREAAAVTGTDPVTVLDTVTEAQAAGMVDAAGPGRFAFSHELVRSTLEAALPAGDRLDAHARAATVVAGDGPVVRSDRLARRAHHALEAAARSVDDARLAVEACRDAARSMIGSLAYEQADALLSAAVRLHEPSSLGHPPADLLVQWAQAALHCGRLTEARLRFDWAASVAERAGDQVMLAEAALGLGGQWLHEHRMPVERSRVLALQRSAQAVLGALGPVTAVPEEHRALACRLRTRLAAETAFDGGPIEPVLQALDDARACGDPLAHAEALQLAQHALFSAEHNRLRLALSEEQVRVASEAGNGLLALMGLYWRAVNLFHLGDMRARRALEELRERADALAHQEMRYLVAVIDVMLLIRQGRLAEAEAEAHRCYSLGEATGEGDALGYLGGHILAIRWAQGREGELLDMMEEVAASPTRVTSDFSLWAVAAAIAARSGQLDRARAGLDRLTAEGGGLDRLRRSSTWLGGMSAIAEAAAALGDEAVAREAHALLAPFADLPTVVSAAMLCLGSVRRPLGLAAAAFGDLDLAVEHLEQAVAANHRFGNRPFAAIAQAELATTLTRRARSGDHARAADLLRGAITAADDMAMTARAATWRSDLAALTDQPPARAGTAISDTAPAAGPMGTGAAHGARPADLPATAGSGGPADVLNAAEAAGTAAPTARVAPSAVVGGTPAVGAAGRASATGGAVGSSGAAGPEDAGAADASGAIGPAGPADATGTEGGRGSVGAAGAAAPAGALGAADVDAAGGPDPAGAPGTAGAADGAGEAARKGVIWRMGPGWLVGMAGRSVVVPDLIGMRYLVELLTRPGVPVSALALASGGRRAADPAVHELLDEEARVAYSTRARELTEELRQCEADNDIGRAEMVRAELDALVDELESATGLGDRLRTFPDDAERARTAVRKAIKRVIDMIDRADPAIARHLRDYVVTGISCTYLPPPDAAIDWSTRSGSAQLNIVS